MHSSLTMQGTVLHSKEASPKLRVLDDILEVALQIKALDPSILSVGHTHQVELFSHCHAVGNVKHSWGRCCWCYKIQGACENEYVVLRLKSSTASKRVTSQNSITKLTPSIPQKKAFIPHSYAHSACKMGPS